MSKNSVPFNHPWGEDLIGNLGSITVGGTPRTSVEKYWDGDVPWMASGDVKLKKVTDVPGRITELGLRHSNASIVDSPTVAIGLAGQGRTRGTVALVLCRLCTNQSVALIKSDPEVLDTRYLFYNLEFRYEELRSRSSGGGRAGLTKQILEQIPIPLPALSEQKKIAEVLSTVDQAIEETETSIAKQHRIKTGLMQDLLTRGIDEHGNLRSEKTHQFEDSPLGRVPVEWEVRPLDDLLVEKRYGISTSLSEEPEGVPVLRMNNLVYGEVDYSNLKYSRRRDALSLTLNDGDVLFNRTNSIDYVGRTGIYRHSGRSVSFASYLVRLVTDSDKLCAGYLNVWLNDVSNQIRVKQLATIGVQQANVNPTNLGMLLISLPRTVTEQKKIIDHIASVSQSIHAADKSLQKLRSLKTALMQDLLTGKKRVMPLLNDTEVTV
ncbi:restriction endonuclease subunit S [Tumebacillus sp. DT12]|uniref:Restriction endonuclease subunit S n=1 Tax=Tumebacillus lacus TaxID=2995335 RepID=A0ABT3X302_9BACL|nr:restriction endonuclease subunit S [Tumebacillus lacus]MCX7571291.1 restriction endonuclease subunit S [Tumebacillus lacus]